MLNYKNILIPIDFSECSIRAAKKGMALAQQLSANVMLITIVEPLPAIAYGYMGTGDIEEDIFEHAKLNLANIADDLDVDGENCFIEMGHPKTDLVEFAKKVKADLIVMGKHGHRHAVSHLLGSTITSVSNHCHCDVFIVHD